MDRYTKGFTIFALILSGVIVTRIQVARGSKKDNYLNKNWMHQDPKLAHLTKTRRNGVIYHKMLAPFNPQLVSEIYQENNYWLRLSAIPDFQKYYSRSYEYFKTSPSARYIAAWVAVAHLYDSSVEYQNLIERILKDVNDHALGNFYHLQAGMKYLRSQDEGIKEHILNLVAKLDIPSAKKMTIYAREIKRKRFRYEKDNHYNLYKSIYYLKRFAASPQFIKKAYYQSLANNKDLKVQRILSRSFMGHFPYLKQKARGLGKN